MGHKVENKVVESGVMAFPAACQCVTTIINECVSRSRFLKMFLLELEAFTATDLADWVDSVQVGYSEELLQEMHASGYVSHFATPNMRSFYHPKAKLPQIVVHDSVSKSLELVLRVESVPDFCMMRGIKAFIEGGYFAPLRKAVISKENGIVISVVERRSHFQLEPATVLPKEIEQLHMCKELWQARPRIARLSDDEEEVANDILERAEELVRLVGKSKAAVCVLEIERNYWLKNNRAGQMQYFRQQSLGVGFANCSHHTFRSSRKYFAVAVRLFEILGFVPVDTIFAKTRSQIGTAALIMEQPKTKEAVHIEVDAEENEIQEDFAHKKLEEKKPFGETGLWCALHGESIFQAGMHHLAINCSIAKAQRFFSEKDVMVMPPSTELPYFNEAFTVGDVWKVHPDRLKAFLGKGNFTDEELSQYLIQGFMGSQMALVERKEGYKGFGR